ncbi:MAG: YlmH/Sll1252 family protein [Lachnospiraceae bacterium]|nr:YlmH/Sll1252 family protein [Lachnospiraceae bacterium]
MNADKEKEFLIKRIYDLADTSLSRQTYTYTNFLSPLEQDYFLSCSSDFSSVGCQLWGGASSCLRKLIIFGSEDNIGYPLPSPIRILHIAPKAAKFAEELSHRDYLGSLMALGIDRGLTGDIIIRDHQAWVYVLDSVVSFITENLTSVRHTAVLCTEVEGEIPELEIKFQTISANLASERLDLILGAITGQKREQAKSLLADQKVFVNGRLAENSGKSLKAGDEITVRGFGKFIYDGISSESRKGRLNITIRKYV